MNNFVRRVPNIALQKESQVLLVGRNESPLVIEPGEVQSLESVITCMDPGLYSFSVRVPAPFRNRPNRGNSWLKWLFAIVLFDVVLLTLNILISLYQMYAQL